MQRLIADDACNATSLRHRSRLKTPPPLRRHRKPVRAAQARPRPSTAWTVAWVSAGPLSEQNPLSFDIAGGFPLRNISDERNPLEEGACRSRRCVIPLTSPGRRRPWRPRGTKSDRPFPDTVYERERARLAYIVAALVAIAGDEDDLARRAVARYRQSAVA